MIPIYRAKKIDSDEYVEGQLTKLYIPDIEIISEDEQSDIQRWAYFIVNDISMLDVGCSFTYCRENRFNFKVSEKSEIDIATLAIHFPNMLDSQGNKIFASLSEDGKGGDIFILGDERLKYIAKMHNNQLMGKQQGTYGSLIGQGYATTEKWKVIGIQE